MRPGSLIITHDIHHVNIYYDGLWGSRAESWVCGVHTWCFRKKKPTLSQNAPDSVANEAVGPIESKLCFTPVLALPNTVDARMLLQVKYKTFRYKTRSKPTVEYSTRDTSERCVTYTYRRAVSANRIICRNWPLEKKSQKCTGRAAAAYVCPVENHFLSRVRNWLRSTDDTNRRVTYANEEECDPHAVGVHLFLKVRHGRKTTETPSDPQTLVTAEYTAVASVRKTRFDV